MATLTLSDLEQRLEALGLKTPVPRFEETADVLQNPLDIARAYLADIVRGLADCSEDTAYKSIQWPNNIYNGDLAVILPRLAQKGDHKKLGFDIVQRVG